jgi:hypothetical protein
MFKSTLSKLGGHGHAEAGHGHGAEGHGHGHGPTGWPTPVSQKSVLYTAYDLPRLKKYFGLAMVGWVTLVGLEHLIIGYKPPSVESPERTRVMNRESAIENADPFRVNMR